MFRNILAKVVKSFYINKFATANILFVAIFYVFLNNKSCSWIV